jgi:D-aspartate ligase
VILGGSENALSVARSLGSRGITVHVLGDGVGTNLTRYSRFVSSFLTVADLEERSARWLDWLESGPRKAVVLACSDAALEFVAQHRPWLVENSYLPVEANDAITLAMLDKASTYELARDAGFDVPRTAAVADAADLDAAVDGIGFPCALKPRSSHRYYEVFGGKAIVVRSPEELRQVFDPIDAAGLEVLVSEIVLGVDDSCCSYYSYLDERGEPLLHFTKRKLRQYPIGFGGGTYHVSHWDADVAELGLRLLQAIGLRGIGNVEFKRDRRDGRLKLIECNPRLTAADALLRRAGVDLPHLAYARALGGELDLVDGFRSGVRQWYPDSDFRALLAYRAAGQLTTRRWVASLAHVQHFPVFDRRDVRPSVVGAGRWIRRAARRVVRGPRRGR